MKTGSGAFMKEAKESEFLAGLMVETGECMGKKMVALITDMDQPLGRSIGNALEVVECVEVLRGRFAGSEDLVELTVELCGWMFLLGGRTASKDEGARWRLRSFRAARRCRSFASWCASRVAMLGVLTILRCCRALRIARRYRPTASGYVSAMECERMGMAGVMLGGGRVTKDDVIDAAVGIVLHKKVGDAISAGEALCTVHYNSVERFAEAKPVISASYSIGAHKPRARELIQKVIQGRSV